MVSLKRLFSVLDYGSVPDWLAATGTVLALVLAALAYRRDVNLRAQSRRESARKQARKVTVEAEPFSVDRHRIGVDRDDLPFSGNVRVKVFNGSDDDIKNVLAVVKILKSEGFMFARQEQTVEVKRGFVAEGQLAVLTSQDFMGTYSPDRQRPRLRILSVKLKWVDDEGPHWTTNPAGRVTRTEGPSTSK